MIAGAIISVALAITYITLLRLDPAMVPLAIGIMAAIGALGHGAQRAYPGALVGAAIGAILAALMGWWWFRILRRARVKASVN